MGASRGYQSVAFLIVLAALLLLGGILPVYPRFVLSMILVNVIAVSGLNLVMGYGGQISLGHAGFAAIGAYVVALLVTNAGWAFWPALAIGVIGAGFVGLLVGLPALRLRHIYLAVATWSFGVGVTLVLVNWYNVTRGPNGIAIPPPQLWGIQLGSEQFFYVLVAFAALTWILTYRIIHSRLGRSLKALRESEIAARAVGVNIVNYKVIAFTLSAMYGGLAGGLYAGLSQFVNPDGFLWTQSILWVTMTAVGGRGTLLGPVLGAALLTLLPELIGSFDRYAEVISGSVLLVSLIFLRDGVVGLVRDLSARWRRPAVAEASAAPSERVGRKGELP